MTNNAMERRGRNAIRDVELMTRWTLVMLQNAERGLVPLKALERFVDPAVITAIGPIEPPRPGAPPFQPHVGSIRVELVHDELAHVACVARRQDGRSAGHVLEFHREAGRHWRITELTRVEERRLVSPAERGVALDEQRRRFPADLSSLMAATEHAHTQAREALEKAQAEAARLRRDIDQMGAGKSTWRVRERSALVERQRAASLAVGRWERTVAATRKELRELQEVRELREVRQRVVDGDPIMAVRNAEHLERLLGPIPADRDDRRAWREAANTVESYRRRWDVLDSERALGDLPPNAEPDRVQGFEHAAEAARSYATRHNTIARQAATDGALEVSL